MEQTQVDCWMICMPSIQTPQELVTNLQLPCQDGLKTLSGPCNEIPIAGLGPAVGTLRVTGSESGSLLE